MELLEPEDPRYPAVEAPCKTIIFYNGYHQDAVYTIQNYSNISPYPVIGQTGCIQHI